MGFFGMNELFGKKEIDPSLLKPKPEESYAALNQEINTKELFLACYSRPNVPRIHWRMCVEDQKNGSCRICDEGKLKVKIMREKENQMDEKIESMINSHWNYIRELLELESKGADFITLSLEDYLEMIEFHYKTAFQHGYKHGKQDS